MRDDPGMNTERIVASLDAHYGLRVASVMFLPIGYDLNAAVYEIITLGGTAYFLKIRFGPVHEPGLLVPRALIDHGIPNVLAPLPTRSSFLWCPLAGYDGYTMVLYPFIRGENAVVAGLSDDQWQEFGSTLRAVHDRGIGERFRDQLPSETFSLPSAAAVRRMMSLVGETEFESPAAAQFAAFSRDNAEHIHTILTRAESLGRSLLSTSFDNVLCHADIHAANILAGDDGRIHLVDWDGPIIAPRERDLLFIVGSTIARTVEPREERLFFAGYGPVEINPTAITYYRYERVIEDIGEIGKSVFVDAAPSEQMRAAEAEFAMSFFAPDGAIAVAETVILDHSRSQ